MPLRDHFHSPLMDLGPWEAIHGGWPMVIIQHLARCLPERFVAAPRVHLGAQAEIDIAAFDRDPRSPDQPDAASGRTKTAIWAPVEPTLARETALADFDEYEVQIFDTRYGRKLVAAIEIISPANKDRPESRRQFTAKCASLIRQGICVVLVDLVTSHHFNLYAELLEWIGQHDEKLTDPPPVSTPQPGVGIPTEPLACWKRGIILWKLNSRCQLFPSGSRPRSPSRWILKRAMSKRAVTCGSSKS